MLSHLQNLGESDFSFQRHRDTKVVLIQLNSPPPPFYLSTSITNIFSGKHLHTHSVMGMYLSAFSTPAE